jgi:hypothetical protein
MKFKPIDKLITAPLQALALKMGWAKLDAYLTERAPLAWPAVKRAIPGWKTYTGAALLAWPTFSGHVTEQLVALGINPTKAYAILGGLLVAVGLVDKGLAFLVHFLNGATSEPVANLPNKPVLRSFQEHQYFSEQLAGFMRAGMTFEEARSEALNATLLAFPR